MRKILLVEDNTELNVLYKQILEKQGYTVEIAETGAELKSKLENYEPDIFILDIMLPDSNGIDILKDLKSENSKWKRKPVLMLTGVSEIKEMKRSLELGAAGYVMKGGSIDELNKRISMLLNSFR